MIAQQKVPVNEGALGVWFLYLFQSLIGIYFKENNKSLSTALEFVSIPDRGLTSA
jgi:hypothetical protein